LGRKKGRRKKRIPKIDGKMPWEGRLKMGEGEKCVVGGNDGSRKKKLGGRGGNTVLWAT